MYLTRFAPRAALTAVHKLENGFKKKPPLLSSLHISQSWIAIWFSLWLLTLLDSRNISDTHTKPTWMFYTCWESYSPLSPAGKVEIMLALSSDPWQIFISIFSSLSIGVPLISALMWFPIIKITNPAFCWHLSKLSSNYGGFSIPTGQFRNTFH